ncbi:hypothetical protein MMC16_005858 [Acarospora aff. strigata]|nr:hypothetical protein [Acarospora aff. strigata]
MPTLIEYLVRKEGANRSGQLSLLNYSDRVLACLYELDDGDEDAWLIAVDVRPGPATRRRIRATIRLESVEKLFVRHNKDYLYYGTHSGMASHGHHEWVIKGIPLPDFASRAERHSLQLSNLVGSDIGCTVAFEIYNGYFYALSNQTSFDVQEVDWTSFYHCLRFPLDKPQKEDIEVNREIWRRQHTEGPINDSWTDLQLRKDERFGELLIVECRREWKGGGSHSQRTFYTQSIDFRKEDELGDTTPTQSSSLDGTESTCTRSIPHALPADDPLTSTLDENSKPNWAPPRTRLKRDYHDEPVAASKSYQTFTLAKTKYRTYNPSSSSFLDVVIDSTRSVSTAPSPFPRQQVRIRIGSRRLKSPLKKNGLLRERQISEETGQVRIGSEERFIDRDIRLWPPENAPSQLLDILNPSSDMSEVEASSDERSVVYMAGSSYSAKGRPIVLINFDAALNFAGLPLLDPRGLRSRRVDGSEGHCDVMLEPRRIEDCKGKQASQRVGPSGSVSGTVAPWFRTERAMYCDIGMGFRLR